MFAWTTRTFTVAVCACYYKRLKASVQKKEAVLPSQKIELWTDVEDFEPMLSSRLKYLRHQNL